ncbi:putative disease resistance RPP13-like protein 1 [Fagus crenata]
MSVIGEAAISYLLETIFDKLTSSFKQEQVDADFQKWKRILLKIHAVLDDAEEKQKTSWVVKIWLDELQDLAYEVEDILGDFSNEVLRCELNPEPNKNKIRNIIDACVGSNKSFAMSMWSKIEDIDTRLQIIVTISFFLELRENTGGRTRTTRSRVPTSSLVNEGYLCYRLEEKLGCIKQSEISSKTLILKEPYEGVNICKQVFEWGSHRLMSLTFLYIDGGFLDWKSFPSEEDGKMTTLPSSLTKLEIWNFPNIVFLSSKGFENLSALVELASLPKKGLPPLLLQLCIYECPLLKPHCKKGKGREWLKIVNIPLVEIDLAGEAL